MAGQMTADLNAQKHLHASRGFAARIGLVGFMLGNKAEAVCTLVQWFAGTEHMM
jgi:hypothetical protein